MIDTIQANAFSGAQPAHFFLPIVPFLENPTEKLVHQQQHLELLFCGRPGVAALVDCTMGAVRSTLWVGVLGLALPSRPLPGENRLSAQGGNFWLLSPCIEGSFPPG